MDSQRSVVGWPSAVVASMIIALIGAVTVAAIIEYSVGDALKMWGALSGLVGLLTGAFVTYFFTRSAVDTAQEQAKEAQAQTEEARAQAAAAAVETAAAKSTAAQHAARAERTQRALVMLAGHVDPPKWEALKADPTISMVLAPPVD